MKKHVCAAALALCFVLAACAPEPGASSASVPSSSAAASSLPPASGTAGQAAPPLDLPYEKIQPVADHATPYPYLACGFDGSGPVYYTMCRGGLWGLMREDFTVVLECRAPQPMARCHLGHWSWGSDGMNWDELDDGRAVSPAHRQRFLLQFRRARRGGCAAPAHRRSLRGCGLVSGRTRLRI